MDNNLENAVNAAYIEQIKADYVVPQHQGACRVYIDFGKVRKNSKLAKQIESVTGGRWFNRPYYSYRNLYIGYDNFSGQEIAKAQKWANAFKDNGVSAYVSIDLD